MRLRSQTFDVEGSALNVAVGPENGPPLIFLHGVTRCWRDLLPVIGPLSDRWQTVAVDFRGHGMSGPRPGRYRVLDYVADAVTVLRFVAEQAGSPAAIYGHSLGAMVAFGAATGPGSDWCRGVVLEDPPFDTMGHLITATPFHGQFAGMRPLAGSDLPVGEVARLLGDIPTAGPGGMTVPLRQLRDSPALRLAATFLKDVDPDVFDPILAGEWLEHYALAVSADEVRCPVLLLQGDTSAGGMLRDEDADRLESELADCTRVRLPGAGHLLHWDHGEAVIRWTRQFLESTRGQD